MASKLPRLLQRTAKAGAAVGALYIADENLNYSSFTRSIRALWNGLMIAVDYKMNFTKDNAAEILQIHSRAAQRILETCQTNGGLFIKLGQGIALQNHILPPEFNERFKILYDQAPAVPYNDVRFSNLIPEEFH